MSGDASLRVHGTAVVIREAGIVIRGPSGAGKSSLALLLIEAARQRGCFSSLVGDDCLVLTRYGDAVIAAPHPAIAGLIERRTQPLASAPHEPRCRVRLVVDLLPLGAMLPRLPEEDAGLTMLAGVEGVPCLRLQGLPHALWYGIIFDKLAAC